MKPKFWNKGKIYLSNKDKVLKNIISLYSSEHLDINFNYYHSLINLLNSSKFKNQNTLLPENFGLCIQSSFYNLLL